MEIKGIICILIFFGGWISFVEKWRVIWDERMLEGVEGDIKFMFRWDGRMLLLFVIIKNLIFLMWVRYSNYIILCVGGVY